MMTVHGRDEPLVPFPRLTAAGGTQSATELWLRPFGLYEPDLGVDFGSGLRPLAVTQVLACCTRGPVPFSAEDEFLWSLPVGKRVQALVTLAAAWDGAGIPLTLRCPDDACGQEMEVDVTLDELTEIQDEAYSRTETSIDLGDGMLVLRRPTGVDQLSWLRRWYADELEAAAAMVRTLAVPDSTAQPVLTEERLAAVEAAMDELDPLVNFVANIRCFGCGREHPHGIDLEDIALRRLRGAQLGLLSTVHRLAGRYHWSEQQIFAVPHWRRSHYLALIEREKR